MYYFEINIILIKLQLAYNLDRHKGFHVILLYYIIIYIILLYHYHIIWIIPCHFEVCL